MLSKQPRMYVLYTCPNRFLHSNSYRRLPIVFLWYIWIEIDFVLMCGRGRGRGCGCRCQHSNGFRLLPRLFLPPPLPRMPLEEEFAKLGVCQGVCRKILQNLSLNVLAVSQSLFINPFYSLLAARGGEGVNRLIIFVHEIVCTFQSGGEDSTEGLQ